MRRAAVTIVALIFLAGTLVPASALADGDPASDVLIGQNVYYPYSPAVSAGLQKTLNAETAAAARARFPIKVALIPSPQDLGALPTLFGKPQQYASFLDQEISFLNNKPLLLVVMPNGYGVQHLGAAATTAAESLIKPPTRQSDDLARSAIVAVRKLAAVAGHPLPAVSSATGGSGGSTALSLTALALASVVCAAVVFTVRNRRATNIGRRLEVAARAPSPAVSEPRLLIGLTLIAAGLGWALARGLTFYGLTLSDIAYDFDQPPVLLVLVGGWLLYRSRRS